MKRSSRREKARTIAKDAQEGTCHKIGWPSKRLARGAVLSGHKDGLPFTAFYKCPRCGKWHTTTQEQRRGNAKKTTVFREPITQDDNEERT